MQDDQLHLMLAAKKAVVFDLWHTLTALEITGASGPSSSEILGIDRGEWDSLMEAGRADAVLGRQRDPLAIMRQCAHAIDPSVPEERIRQAASTRMAKFRHALLHASLANVEVLRQLRRRGKRLGLLSNADVTEVAGWGESPLAECFDEVVFSCQVGLAKPQEEIYQLCAARLGVKPSECIFVGDGGSEELQGARAVGMATVLMSGIIRQLWPEKIPPRRQFADFEVQDLAQLLPRA